MASAQTPRKKAAPKATQTEQVKETPVVTKKPPIGKPVPKSGVKPPVGKPVPKKAAVAKKAEEDKAKLLQALQTTGKSIDEVLAFMKGE